MLHVPSEIFSARTLSLISKGLGAPVLAAGFIWSAQGLGLLGADFAAGRPVLLGIGLAVTILAFGWLHFAKGPPTPRGVKSSGR
jgi:hypothetical protein